MLAVEVADAPLADERHGHLGAVHALLLEHPGDEAGDELLVDRRARPVDHLDDVHEPGPRRRGPDGLGARPRRAHLVVVRLVRVDDALDELVAHHVVPVELHDADVVNVVEDLGTVTSPEVRLCGRSIWVTSPVTTICCRTRGV